MGIIDFEYIISILSTVLSMAIAISATRINTKIHKNQEKFSEQTMDMINDVAEEVRQENQNIIKEITINLNNKDDTIIEDILNKINNNGSKILNSKRFDDKIEELIQNHHEQAIQQSLIQFWFSLIASVIGFIFIIAIIVFSNDLQWYEYIVKIIPGIIIEAVSVLFFSQSKETRERASDFLNRLREDRQFAKSIAIIDTIQDEELKSLVKAEIALYFCGIKDIDIITKKLENN